MCDLMEKMGVKFFKCFLIEFEYDEFVVKKNGLVFLVKCFVVKEVLVKVLGIGFVKGIIWK